jgi:glutamate racemase
MLGIKISLNPMSVREVICMGVLRAIDSRILHWLRRRAGLDNRSARPRWGRGCQIGLCLIILLAGVGVRADGPGQHDDSGLLARAARTAREARRAAGSIDPLKYPIGVFDSGTGGLTVLEAILALDTFDNETTQYAPQGDGRPDLAGQSFIYLADQANMPYGNYPNVGRERFLEELIVKDVEFLLGNRYYPDAVSDPARDKLPVKAVVIACNTATAYGKDSIEQLIAASGLDVPVVGVVGAGVRGALELFADGQNGTIGVLATRATVLADAYPRGIQAEIDRRAWPSGRPRIDVVQQGSLGLAGAIDGAEEFLVQEVASSDPRDGYQGPSLDHPFARIDPRILPRYALEFDGHGVLFDGPQDQPTTIQLNSVANYLKYDLVSLLETLRRSPDPQPLRAIILACTHFPYRLEAFERELQRLAEYQEDGVYIYRDYLASQIEWIDPAYFAARELYVRLVEASKLDPAPDDFIGQTRAEFYITVPCVRHPAVRVSLSGQFTFDYKYGSQRPPAGTDYRAVPLRHRELDDETADRLRNQAPSVWKLLDEFNGQNPKAAASAAESRRSSLPAEWTPADSSAPGAHSRALNDRSADLGSPNELCRVSRKGSGVVFGHAACHVVDR